MRLHLQARQALVQSVRTVAPHATTIRLFGSRLDDNARGGDVDIMVEFDQPVEHPAMLSASIGVQAERIEAFVSRFGRLQDNLGDKLLPQLLRLVEEPVGAAIDNIDRAERVGWISSADQWLNTRRLRNQMKHDYIEDAAVYLDALLSAHSLVPMIAATAGCMLQQVSFRLGQP